jgi:hypothetical protein
MRFEAGLLPAAWFEEVEEALVGIAGVETVLELMVLNWRDFLWGYVEFIIRMLLRWIFALFLMIIRIITKLDEPVEVAMGKLPHTQPVAKRAS